MREIERLKEEILKEYPRLDKNNEFTFACHPGVACFNDCCRDVNIFLTPYDIIRLKNSLGISSAEFLSKYTVSPFDKNLKYPVILLQMNEDDSKSCPFVGEAGCRVYDDRPWACRMYPLGLASPKEGVDPKNEEFYFLLEEAICKGFREKTKQTIADWLEDQGINEYNANGEQFKELTLHKYFEDGPNLTPEKMEMFFLACYNIDTFRDFVVRSSFFDKFEVDDETRRKIEKDDVELLKFGYEWLRFAIFGEKTLKINDVVLEAKKKELEKRNAAKPPTRSFSSARGTGRTRWQGCPCTCAGTSILFRTKKEKATMGDRISRIWIGGRNRPRSPFAASSRKWPRKSSLSSRCITITGRCGSSRSPFILGCICRSFSCC
jgi:Fe-S-cluster containining protein